jgi:4-hydroxybenzoate polyprenyltransferase
VSVNTPKARSEVPPDLPQTQRVGRSLPVALLMALRPKQATKNLFVFAALVFVGPPLRSIQIWQAVIAFLLFVAVSGSVYLLNDLLDVQQDRIHPEKRHRPIASGDLPVSVAWTAMILIAVAGLMAGFALRFTFGLVLATYFVLQLVYCFHLKHIVLLDVFSIAFGFVLRTVAGGVAADISISRWLMLCSLLLALLLGFGKRRQELVLLGENAGRHRKILDEYSLPFLDQIINIVAGVTLVCYAVYCVESPASALHPHLWITIPIVIYSVCRYLYLVYQKGMGGAPDEVLLKDRVLQLAMGLWLLLILVIFAFDHPGVKFSNIKFFGW